MDKINIFCLPFAGASFFSYNHFISQAPSGVKFIPLELPGRGRRLKERLLYDIHVMADDVFHKMKDRLVQPYAIYGHSMGALLGYLVIKKIVSEDLAPPRHLFVSGAKPPALTRTKIIRHRLPKKQFLNELLTIGGTTQNVLEDPALMDFFEPILRADFQATENYEHVVGDAFDIPMTCMIGSSEDITLMEAEEWQKETSARVNVLQFTGNHFFIFDHTADIVRVIRNQLVTLEYP